MKLKLFNHTGIAGGLLIYLALLDKSSSKEITKKRTARMILTCRPLFAQEIGFCIRYFAAFSIFSVCSSALREFPLSCASSPRSIL